MCCRVFPICKSRLCLTHTSQHKGSSGPCFWDAWIWQPGVLGAGALGLEGGFERRCELGVMSFLIFQLSLSLFFFLIFEQLAISQAVLRSGQNSQIHFTFRKSSDFPLLPHLTIRKSDLQPDLFFFFSREQTATQAQPNPLLPPFCKSWSSESNGIRNS